MSASEGDWWPRADYINAQKALKAHEDAQPDDTTSTRYQRLEQALETAQIVYRNAHAAQVEQVKLQVEQERRQAEQVKLQVEQERMRVEQVKLQVEQERMQVQQVKLQVEQERMRVEQVKLQVEQARKQVEQVKLQAARAEGDACEKKRRLREAETRAAKRVRSTSQHCTPSALEPITVNNQTYYPRELLGRGGSCTVYSVKDTDSVKNAVVKVYDSEEVRHAEQQRLDSFTTTPIKQFVPVVVTGEEKHLIVTPHADDFKEAELRVAHATHLMSILEYVHNTMHLVHRDVRPANFFNVPQAGGRPGVLLNDWASSVESNQVVTYSGSPGPFKADWLPNDGSLYKARPKDDLYSFVVSCYSLTYTNAPADAALPQAWQAACATCCDGNHAAVLAAVKPLLYP